MNSLGVLERRIMDVLWDGGSWLTVRDVVGRISDRDLAYTTVMTVMNRLVRKDFLLRERTEDGRTWRYRPAAGREAYVAELMLSALSETGDRLAALGHFARSVTAEEAEALRGALPGNSAGEGGGGDGGGDGSRGSDGDRGRGSDGDQGRGGDGGGRS